MGERSKRDEPSSTAVGQTGLPLARTAQLAELFDRVGDAEHMLAVFRRELPPLADVAIQIVDLSAKPSRSRRSIKKGRLEVIYEVGIETSAGRSEHVLFGIAPAPPELLDSELKEQRRKLRGHPWGKPFRELALYLEELDLALLFFPLDPALPGLSEITGSEGARLLAESLPECRAGQRIERLDCELVHYKPCKRAVLKMRVALRGAVNGAHERNVYAKFFADDQGATSFQNLNALWSAARGATSLRLPEPLGYDPLRRMLVLSEVAGQRELVRWVRGIENGDPPADVDLLRMKRCARVAAESLVELQRSGVHSEERRGFQDELANVKKDCALLLDEVRKTQPDLTAAADGLLQRLEQLTPASERLVPAHGAYRHDQMLGDEHSLTPIDWDGFSLASPALDAATFIARLRREPRRRPGSAPELEQMAATFRAAFLEHRPELTHELDLYEGLQVTEQMLRAFRRPGDGAETASEVRHLAAAAAGVLERVERAAT